MGRSLGSQPGEASSSLAIATMCRGVVEGVGILRLSFKQEFAGSIPVYATNTVTMERSPTWQGARPGTERLAVRIRPLQPFPNVERDRDTESWNKHWF